MPISGARISGIFGFIAKMSERVPARRRDNPQPDRGVCSLLDKNVQFMRLAGLDPSSRLDQTRFFDIEERFVAKTPGTIDQVFAVLIKRTSDKTFLGQFVREFKDALQLELEAEKHYFNIISDPSASESEANYAGFVIWNGHQKTIVELANEYIAMAEGGLELVDLIEAGRVGLLESIKSCSPCREAIEQAVAKAAREGKRVKWEDFQIGNFNPLSAEEGMIDFYAENIERSQQLEMVLPELENRVLTLLYEEGLSTQEVAEQLGMLPKEVVIITRGALKKRQQSRES